MATASNLASCLDGNFTGVPLPLTLHLPMPMNDAQLLEFSQKNPLYRMERTADGDLEIMTPVGGNGSRWEAYVVRELDQWAERAGGICFSSSGGFSLPDGSMRSPTRRGCRKIDGMRSQRISAAPFLRFALSSLSRCFPPATREQCLNGRCECGC